MPPRDGRYDYPPPPPAMRDIRRPPSPRDYREYGPPPGARPREYDDFRRGPPPPPVADRDRFPPQPDYRGRYPPPPPQDAPYRGYGAPPAPVYDRYDRRPNDRYQPYPQPPGPRPRTPPRVRDDYDRAGPPPRFVLFLADVGFVAYIRNSDYLEYRGRPVSPPRYPPDYGRTHGNNSPGPRYRFVQSSGFLKNLHIDLVASDVDLRVPLGLLLLPMKGIRL
jgi:hypothetical protein